MSKFLKNIFKQSDETIDLSTTSLKNTENLKINLELEKLTYEDSINRSLINKKKEINEEFRKKNYLSYLEDIPYDNIIDFYDVWHSQKLSKIGFKTNLNYWEKNQNIICTTSVDKYLFFKFESNETIIIEYKGKKILQELNKGEVSTKYAEFILINEGLDKPLGFIFFYDILPKKYENLKELGSCKYEIIKTNKQ